MTRKILYHLRAEDYQHPADRKALATLEKTPGLPLLLKKINEYGIDRLLRLQVLGNEFRVTPNNFPKLHDSMTEACEILNVSPMPELYLYRGTGHISNHAIGVEKPLIGVNLEAMEWLSYEELLFLLGYELSRIKGGYLSYQQLVPVMPLLKSLISSTTLGLGGLAANGLEVALYNWILMTKFTADRMGLLACQDKNVAITALMKIGGLPGEYLKPEVIRDFIDQARNFKLQDLDGLDQVTKFFSFMEHYSPWIVMRASELLKWVDTGMYDQCIDFNQPKPEEIPEQVGETQTAGDPEDWDFLSAL